MGDTGSLSLGAALGTVSILIREEFLLVIVGGIFVAEALQLFFKFGRFGLIKSVYSKCRLCITIFLLGGWEESKVVIRFWIVALLLMLMALSTLKLR